jgi:aromatase
MSEPVTRKVAHEIKVDAPAETLYQYIAEVGNWPRLFPPTVHVEVLERGESDERIQIWATANGTAKTWKSRRELTPEKLTVRFRQEVSSPPVGSMGGTWIIEPISESQALVRLLHDYRAVDDDPEKLDWIDKAVDRNSTSELAALKTNAEAAHRAGDLLLSFADTVQVSGSSKDAYDFINEAQLWQQRLPHVAKVNLEEDTPGLQLLEMDTMTKDGSVHTTRSYRVTFPHTKITYKQVQVPALMTLHTGQWLFQENESGVAVTSQHTVVINEANIAAILGESAGVPDARDYVRKALSGNSMATLGHAKEYAEARRG